MRASGLGVGFVLSELGFPTSFLQMQRSGSAVRIGNLYLRRLFTVVRTLPGMVS